MRLATPRLLIFACAFALALPASALAATPASVTGPTSIAENGTKATYTITCGTTVNPISSMLPDIPNTGAVHYATAGAGAGEDYTATTGDAPCSPAQPTHMIEVPILDDQVDEPNQSFTFTISSGGAFTGTISPTAGVVTTSIVDNDDPIASIVAASQFLEGDTGTSNLNLAVTLDRPAWQEVTIPFSTQDQSATGGSDFTATSGSIKIPAGQTAGTITIPIIGDTTYEGTEGFFVTLGDTLTGAVANNTKKQTQVVIFDNDPKPSPEFSFGPNQQVVEGNSGTVNMIFTVTLSFAADGDTQVAWKTQNGSADLADYEGGQGILKFAKGETSKTISINVKGDTRKEANEYFAVALEGPVGASIKKGLVGGVILDDDKDGVVPPPAGDGPKVGISKPTRDGKKKLAILVKCPATATACNGILVGLAGKIKVGKARFELTPGGETDLTVKLSLAARRALRNHSLKVTFTAVAKNLAGEAGTSTKTFKIRRTKH